MSRGTEHSDSSCEATFWPPHPPTTPICRGGGAAPSTPAAPRAAPSAPHEAAWPARMRADSVRRATASGIHAGGPDGHGQQMPKEHGIELGKKILIFEISSVPHAPGVGEHVQSCPAQIFARGQEFWADTRAPCHHEGHVARGVPGLAGEQRTAAQAWRSCPLGVKGNSRARIRRSLDSLRAPSPASRRAILRERHGKDEQIAHQAAAQAARMHRTVAAHRSVYQSWLSDITYRPQQAPVPGASDGRLRQHARSPDSNNGASNIASDCADGAVPFISRRCERGGP